jgi:hypothetical protein
MVATRRITPVLVQISRLIVVRALAAVLGWVLRLLSVLARRSRCLGLLVSGHAFADAVDGVGDAAVLDS